MLAILEEDLVCMNDKAARNHFRVDLAYARDDNLLFGERIYWHDAKLWLFEDLAEVVCYAARECYEMHYVRFVLYDGLRTIEAQEAMMKTRRAQENPHWMEEPRLLSLPGGGGHPRAMAVDIGLEDENGNLLDMGCPFDYMAESAYADENPAHREYHHFADIRKNREILDESMRIASKTLGVPLTFLPEEWWDFRLPQEVYEKYAPLSENELPDPMRLMP